MKESKIRDLWTLCEQYANVDDPMVRKLADLSMEALTILAELDNTGVFWRENLYRLQMSEAQRKAAVEHYVADMEGLALSMRDERERADEEKERADKLRAALDAVLAEVAPDGTVGSPAVRRARELVKGGA